MSRDMPQRLRVSKPPPQAILVAMEFTLLVAL